MRTRGGEKESKLGTSLSDSSSVHILCGIIYKERFPKMGRTIFPNRHSTPKGARPASSHNSLAISPHTFLNIHIPLIAYFSKKGKWKYERWSGELSLAYSWDCGLPGLGCVTAKEAKDYFLFLTHSLEVQTDC